MSTLSREKQLQLRIMGDRDMRGVTLLRWSLMPAKSSSFLSFLARHSLAGAPRIAFSGRLLHTLHGRAAS
jgi:hypothetical protein